MRLLVFHRTAALETADVLDIVESRSIATRVADADDVSNDSESVVEMPSHAQTTNQPTLSLWLWRAYLKICARHRYRVVFSCSAGYYGNCTAVQLQYRIGYWIVLL